MRLNQSQLQAYLANPEYPREHFVGELNQLQQREGFGELIMELDYSRRALIRGTWKRGVLHGETLIKILSLNPE